MAHAVHLGPAVPAPSRAQRRGPRLRAMVRVGVAMMLHDRAKLLGAIVGVVFATVLTTQQAATFLGLLRKNAMLLLHADADIWIVPPGTAQLQPGRPLAERILYQARAEAGVAWSAPLLWVPGVVSLPGGGSEQVTVLGVDPNGLHGGPWNLVRGDARSLSGPDAMIFEDSDREKLGGLNLGSVREVNGKRAHVVGLTWGLVPFGPSYAFASYDKARDLARQTDRSQSMVLVKVASGVRPEVVAERLRAHIRGVTVYTREQFLRRNIRWVLTNTPLGVTFGSSALFGLIVGFVIVAISMFSAVLDNVREFGTLKAIGARMSDLTMLLLVQATLYALVGSAVGLMLVGAIASAIRSPRLGLAFPPWLVAGMPLVLVFVCAGASTLALLRLRRMEPGLVFRG